MSREPGRTGKAGGRPYGADVPKPLPEDPALRDPHNIDAEQGLIASCLIDSTGDVLSECISRGIQGEVFYHPQHKVLFDAIHRLFDEGKPIEMIVLTDYLRSNQLLESAGGIVYLSQITNRIESTVHARYWMDIVRDKHVLRQLKRTAETIVREICDSPPKLQEFLGDIEERIFGIGNQMISNTTSHIAGAVDQASMMMSKMMRRENTEGIMSGFKDLDGMTYGLHPQEMTVLAARPSVGKTSLAMNIAENISCGIPANGGRKMGSLIFSLEMGAEQLAMRLLCCRARVDMKRVREGFTSKEEQTALMTAAEELKKAPIWIDDSGSTKITELRAKARRICQKNDISLIVVDYLQLIGGDGSVSRENQIADISRQMKAMAKELKVPVIVLSQLNRESEKERRDPRLSDLRESGSIEQDADVVLMLTRPREKGSDRDDDDGEIVLPSDVERIKLIIAKQRNGPVGIVDLMFQRRYTRYENALRGEDGMNTI